MDHAEHAIDISQVPPFKGFETLLTFNNLDNANSAIQAISDKALATDAIPTKIQAVEMLGKYAGTPFTLEDYNKNSGRIHDWDVYPSQGGARQRILAIGLSTDNPELQLAALNNLAKGFNVSEQVNVDNTDSGVHRMVLQELTVLACSAKDLSVKTKAIEHLHNYASRKIEKRWNGVSARPDYQNLTSEAVKAIIASERKVK